MKNNRMYTPLEFMRQMSDLADKLEKGKITADTAAAICTASREYVRQANLTLQLAKASGKPLPKNLVDVLEDE
jgi:hypothetical protein